MVALVQGNPVKRAYDALCDRAVTVYHRDGADDITRTVYAKAFIDRDKGQNVTKTGNEETTGHLIVIPGDFQACQVGDKVIEGEGPQITTDAEWRAFIPSKVDGLVVVRHVDCKPWGGGIAHTEARG